MIISELSFDGKIIRKIKLNAGQGQYELGLSG
jgi:hypothetical protein